MALHVAFLESCCSHLPAFNWFHSRLPDFRGDLSNLSGSAKVSIAAFSAIGARASPHSVSTCSWFRDLR